MSNPQEPTFDLQTEIHRLHRLLRLMAFALLVIFSYLSFSITSKFWVYEDVMRSLLQGSGLPLISEIFIGSGFFWGYISILLFSVTAAVLWRSKSAQFAILFTLAGCLLQFLLFHLAMTACFAPFSQITWGLAR